MKWYEKDGVFGDIVVSTRLRLARNIAEYPFPGRLTPEDEKKIVSDVSSFLIQSSSDYHFIDLTSADPTTVIGSLMERHLISPEFAQKSGSHGVVVSSDDSVGIMINEEDHLRIQAFGSGLCLDECMKKANEVDDLLERNFNFAWDEKLGYLTKCPTNLGTGMRASVMLHLPAHSITGEIRMLVSSLSKIGFAVRGFYGEGTAASGDLYQISNQLTLGPTEAEMLEKLDKAVRSTIEREKTLRAGLIKNMPLLLEDKASRACGILKNARKISASEAMELISDLRTGVSIGVIKDIPLPVVNKLIWDIQPNHVCARSGKRLNELERDTKRSDIIKESLSNERSE